MADSWPRNDAPCVCIFERRRCNLPRIIVDQEELQLSAIVSATRLHRNEGLLLPFLFFHFTGRSVSGERMNRWFIAQSLSSFDFLRTRYESDDKPRGKCEWRGSTWKSTTIGSLRATISTISRFFYLSIHVFVTKRKFYQIETCNILESFSKTRFVIRKSEQERAGASRSEQKRARSPRVQRGHISSSSWDNKAFQPSTGAGPARVGKVARVVRVVARSIYINTYSLIAGPDCPPLLLQRPG